MVPRLLLPSLLALAFAAACGSDAGREAAELPRARVPVVLYLIDTLRYDRLGCYGHTRDTSPHLDELAREAVVFDWCQAQSTWTKPATASILTGLQPFQHGAVHEGGALPADRGLISEDLHAAGYTTAAFGVNAFVFGKLAGFRRGFDRFRFLTPRPGIDAPSEAVRSKRVVDEALDWVGQVAGEPFFLYVHVIDPHDPYDPPEGWERRFGEPLDDPAWPDERLERPPVAGAPVPPEVRERMLALYDAEIAYADHELGRLLDGLRALGVYDEALVIVLSDHGEEFHEHGNWNHNSNMFQEVIRVPLVVKFPAAMGLDARRHPDMVRQIDVLPTVLDAVGVEPREGLPGTSLIDALLDPADEPLLALTETDRAGRYRKALVRDGVKLVRWWAPETGEALYDLRDDAGERHDLAEQRAVEATALGNLVRSLMSEADRRWTLTFQNPTDEPVFLTGLVVPRDKPLAGFQFREVESAGGGHEVDSISPTRVTSEPSPTGELRVTLADADATGAAPSVTFPPRPAPPDDTAVWFRFYTEPGDRDGAVFIPAPGESALDVMLWVNGHPAPPELIGLGPTGEAPPALPFALDVTRDDLRLAAPGKDARPIRVGEAASLPLVPVELTPEAKANLRALGYVDD